MQNETPAINVMTVLRIGAVLLLLGACLKVILPFTGALIWAAIISISVWPWYLRLAHLIGHRRGLAALLVSSLLMLSIAGPISLMAVKLAHVLPDAQSLETLSHAPLPPPPAWLERIPLAGDKLTQFWLSVQGDLPGMLEKLRPTVNKVALWILEQGASVGFSLLEIILAIVLSGFLLTKGDELWDGANLTLSKLGGSPAGDLAEVVARTVRSVSNGVVGTALAQTILCVIGLLIAGVPGALALGFLCFVFAVAQLPTLLVWLPAAGWVFYTGDNAYGVFLLLWGFLLVNTVDNVLRPLLISQGAQMPLIMIFMGVIGGLLAWGVIGLFIGPTLLAVALTLYRHWLGEAEHPAG
ncbi:AI-2E family transporter [Crenobacter intestini]|uniref:AI-2E family transporter n=1 Tax=Crenobacter intestini TaxID=2563443 RepID=A0A4T0V5Z4_9NEIS|nr:AI-2E family transporter [Crenobacter intestini]TIC87029.1 AI-2E family transporter [Crenobacter intestini]